MKEYLGILKAASQNGEMKVQNVLKDLINKQNLSLDRVLELLFAPDKITPITEINIPMVDLCMYDEELLSEVRS